MKKNIREILHLPARNQMKRYTRSKAGNFFYFLFLFAAGVFFAFTYDLLRGNIA